MPIVLYTDITDEDLQFISKYLKITDSEILRDHVFKIWSECTASVWAYQCIKRLAFLRPRMTEHWYFQTILSLKESKPNAKFLDLGCCFATDTRNLALEGWNPENIKAVYVVEDYWKFGLSLFKDADTIKIQAEFGNVIADDSFAKSIGTFDVVWTGAVLHVLNKSDCEEFLRKIFSFLIPGGIYFGTCAGSTEETEWIPDPKIPKRYLHSSESLEKLLKETGFEEVEVKTHERVSEGSRGSRWREENQIHGVRKMLAFKGKKPADSSKL